MKTSDRNELKLVTAYFIVVTFNPWDFKPHPPLVVYTVSILDSKGQGSRLGLGLELGLVLGSRRRCASPESVHSF